MSQTTTPLTATTLRSHFDAIVTAPFGAVGIATADGQVVAQSDGEPVGGFTPTTRWRQGELVPDTHVLRLPADLPAGQYELRAGMYEPRPGETPAFRNLPLAPQTEDERIHLGTVRVD